MDEWGIKTSYLTCFSGPEFVIEPSFYWQDELGPFRLSLIEPEFAEKWKDIPPNERVARSRWGCATSCASCSIRWARSTSSSANIIRTRS